METILGFVAGYLTGSREGREGLERLRESWRGIRNSPEARKLAADAMGIAELAVRRAAGSGLSGTASGVSGLLDPQARGRPAGQARGLTVSRWLRGPSVPASRLDSSRVAAGVPGVAARCRGGRP